VDKGSAQQLIVAGGAPTPASAAPAEKGTRIFGERLAYIHTDYPGLRQSTAIYASRLFLPLQFLPLLLAGLALGVRWRQNYLERNQDRLQYRAAGSRARREFRETQEALRAGDSEAFHRRLGEALRAYLAVKLRRPAAGLTLEEIESALLEKKVPAGEAQIARQILERCDQARYLPAAANAAGMQELLDRGSSLLQQLDKRL
jgi:hypothetical protein